MRVKLNFPLEPKQSMIRTYADFGKQSPNAFDANLVISTSAEFIFDGRKLLEK